MISLTPNTFNNLKLFLLNCNSINPKLGEIKELMKEEIPDVFCFTETWLSSYIPKFHNYSAEWVNRDSHGGGVGIVVKKTLEYRTRPLTKYHRGHLEVIAIDMYINNDTISLLNVYNPNQNITIDELRHYTLQLSDKFILLGDFNAHTPILSSTTTHSDQTGKSIEEFVTTDNVSLLNPIDFHTYFDRRSGKPSCLDLCFMTPELVTLSTISTQTDVGSDHLTLQILLNINYRESYCQQKEMENH